MKVEFKKYSSVCKGLFISLTPVQKISWKRNDLEYQLETELEYVLLYIPEGTNEIEMETFIYPSDINIYE